MLILCRFGPNTFPAFNSVIFSVEVQVAYIASTLIKPIIDGCASVVEVKGEAEESFIRDLDRTLDETVFAAGCNNWYINSAGRNSAAWPGLAATFWRATAFPKWSDFKLTGGSNLWVLRKTWRKLTSISPLAWLLVAGVAARAAYDGRIPFPDFASQLIGQLKV